MVVNSALTRPNSCHQRIWIQWNLIPSSFSFSLPYDNYTVGGGGVKFRVISTFNLAAWEYLCVMMVELELQTVRWKRKFRGESWKHEQPNDDGVENKIKHWNSRRRPSTHINYYYIFIFQKSKELIKIKIMGFTYFRENLCDLITHSQEKINLILSSLASFVLWKFSHSILNAHFDWISHYRVFLCPTLCNSSTTLKLRVE